MARKSFTWMFGVLGSCVLALGAPAGAAAAKPAKAKPAKAKPDLSVTALVIAGTDRPGATLTATTSVRAAKAAAPASRTNFFVSADATRSSKDVLVATIATAAIKKAGTSTKVVTKFVVPARTSGSYFLIACADGAGKIGEASEKNNCRASAKRTVSSDTAPGGTTTAPGTSVPGTKQEPSATPPAGTGPTTNLPGPPAPPVLRVGAVRSSVEGDSGTARAIEFDVVLDAPGATAVTFTWATSSAMSAGPGDFVASGGDVTIPAGQTSATLTVPIVGDTAVEDDEIVRVVLSNASGATLASPPRADATIHDDEQPTFTVDRGASTQTTVAITFSSAPTNLEADGSQFTIAGLGVSGASLAGKTVTLSTAAQLANQEYTVELASELRAGARTMPPTIDIVGVGPIAQLEITEVNANIAGNADRVELRAVTSGSLVGAAIDAAHYSGGGTYAGLPSMAVTQGALIVVHYASQPGVTTELQGKSQCSASACSTGAWDVSTNPNLTLTPRVLVVLDANGDVTDGVAFRQSTATTADASLLQNLSGLQDDGLWALCGIGHCTTSGEYDSVAVNWSGTATTASGNSVRRIGADTNTAADWQLGPSSWGAANS